MRWSLSRLAFAAAVLGTALATPALAQTTGTIRGRIVESGSQRPLAEAQIGVAGTQLGAATGANGEFTLAGVPAGARTVTVRRIGYLPTSRAVEVPAGGTVQLEVALTVSATQLDQVVVTGTAGAVERRTVGNAITQVNVAELTQRNSILTVSEVLQGKTPGVTILPGSGATGTGGEIRIRGASSTSGYQPVVFIDGIRYNINDLGGFAATGGGTAGLAQSSQVTSALNWLNPADIESIEVIKGPAAATLYGAEAANGVIQIITKKGRRGQGLQWSARAERGQNEWRLAPDPNYTTCDAAKQAATVSATDLTPLWPGCQGLPVNDIITENPIMDDPRAIRTGDLSRMSVTLRGGGDNYTLFISGDRDVEQGVFFNNDNNRTSIRTNFGFTPTEKIDFNVNLGWQDGRVRLPIQDESVNGLLLSSTRGLPGRRSFVGEGNEGWRTISPDGANLYRNYTETDRLTLGGTVNYRPFAWFRNTATLGFDNTTTQAQVLFLPNEISAAQDPDAASGANLRRTPTAQLLTLNYNGDLLWDATPDLTTTTSFGTQVISDRRELLAASGIGLGAPDVTLVNLAQRSVGSESFSENNSVGYYVQEQLGFKDRLFLTGAVRADDHSSFGTDFDLIVYPKVSVSYVASDEPALQPFTNALRLNSLKLRGAWGQAGRAPTAYSAVQTYTVDRVTLGSTTGSAALTSSYGNPDLEPEKGEEIELGFEASGLNDRIGVDFTYYDKTTTNMLQQVAIAPSLGFIGSRWENLGEVSNRGIELSLFGTPVDAYNFRWDTRLNLATNDNELVTFGIEGRTEETPGGQAYGSVQQHRPGYPLGGFWLTRPLRCGVDELAPTAAPCPYNQGEAQLTAPAAGAVRGNPIFTTAREYVGPSIPTREIGFSNTFTFFRYFSLYSLFDYKGGFYVFNAQERSRCQSANDNCWRTNDPRARFPETGSDSVLWREVAVYQSGSVSPEWIQKGDFVKLREVSLTFDVPPQFVARTGAQSMNIVLSGRNLALWSDYEGTDPEVNSYGGRNFVRVDAYAAPMLRRLSAAINLTF